MRIVLNENSSSGPFLSLYWIYIKREAYLLFYQLKSDDVNNHKSSHVGIFILINMKAMHRQHYSGIIKAEKAKNVDF